MKKSKRNKPKQKIIRSKRTRSNKQKEQIMKSSRTVYPAIMNKHRIPNTIQNFGGHIIDPPETCIYKKRDNNVFWCDLALCINCHASCDRFVWFKKASREDRITDLKKRGVRYDF